MSILQTEYDQDKYGEVKLKDGFVEGRTEGLNEGAMKEKIATIQRLLSKNKLIDDISDIVNLPIEQVKEIIESLNK